MNEQRVSGRHPVNIGHLVMGLAFLGIVGIWALVESDTVTGDDIRWLMPIPWVVAGLAGLVAAAVTGSRRYSVRQTGWVGESPSEPSTPTYDAPPVEPQPEETAPLFTQPAENPTDEEKP
jgi:hypothetical protein